MKISKLFHWLYAFLMFLPVTFLLPSLLYFGFNDNAIAQEYTKEEPYYYESNEVNNASDIEYNHIYLFTDNIDVSLLPDLGFIAKVNRDLILEQNISFSHQNDIEEEDNCYLYVNSSSMTLYFRESPYTYDVDIYAFVTNRSFNIIFEDTISNGLATYLADNYIYYTESNYKFVSGYNEITYTMGITESINQSIIDTFDLPMFSWTSDNFLIAPFNYITNLFGLPSDNVVNKYLSYWLTISIVYLCFDVIMYVPLLVHRWIDKARID